MNRAKEKNTLRTLGAVLRDPLHYPERACPANRHCRIDSPLPRQWRSTDHSRDGCPDRDPHPHSTRDVAPGFLRQARRMTSYLTLHPLLLPMWSVSLTPGGVFLPCFASGV